MLNQFVIVVTQYNAVNYIQKCLDSIWMQNYDGYRVNVVDDCSNDGTWEIIQTNPCNSFRNEIRNGMPMTNIITGINKFAYHDNEIIVLLSGDDCFANNNVLSYLNEVYQDDIWFTYGQFIPISGNYGPYCKPIPNTRTYRYSEDWVTSHLLTFKRWLWNKIKDEDLKINGDYSRYACDTSFIYPMVEMCGAKHIKFIDKVIYHYNDLNPSCIYKNWPKDSKRESAYFRSLKQYDEL